VGTFALFLILKNPPMETGQIIGVYHVAQGVLTNARLGFWEILPNFYRGKKPHFSAKFSTRLEIGGLLFHNWEKYEKSKTTGFINDYLTMSTLNLVLVG